MEQTADRIADRESDHSRVLEVADVSKNFGGLRALDQVSLEVHRNLITSLIGPNGSGKTTLFGCISGLIRPTTGRIKFRGSDITAAPPYRITQLGIGRTFQNIRLFPNLNVLENVMAARFCRTRSGFFDALLALPKEGGERRRTREIAEELLQSVGVYERRLEMPGALPYGTRRHVEIARALITGPEVLMLDEPSAGMNAEEAQDLLNLMTRLRDQGLTILLIEHNMYLMKSICDRVAVLNFGRKIAEGAPSQVLNDRTVIEAYLGTDE